MAIEPSLTNKRIARIVAISIAVDLVEAWLDTVPVIGWAANVAVDGAAWLIFYFLFRRAGVRFRSASRRAIFAAGFLLDLIPVINMFAWTADVLAVIASVKREEERETAAAE
ncbi:MAG TPA: hypothetical protein VHF05_03325 [Candidatus Paceibacterota bacterium]|jgi:hypothetical protein|nr:hypothetical protein [Candidatus Paceibacterota bacterium]